MRSSSKARSSASSTPASTFPSSPLRLVLISGQDVGPAPQSGPGVAREQARGDARRAEQQGEPAHRCLPDGSHLAPDDVLALIQLGEVGTIAAWVRSKVP